MLQNISIDIATYLTDVKSVALLSPKKFPMYDRRAKHWYLIPSWHGPISEQLLELVTQREKAFI